MPRSTGGGPGGRTPRGKAPPPPYSPPLPPYLFPASPRPRPRPGRQTMQIMRAVELRQPQPLLDKASQQIVIGRTFMSDQLHRHRPIKAHLDGEVHLAHAADCQPALEAIVAAQDQPFIGRVLAGR